MTTNDARSQQSACEVAESQDWELITDTGTGLLDWDIGRNRRCGESVVIRGEICCVRGDMVSSGLRDMSMRANICSSDDRDARCDSDFQPTRCVFAIAVGDVDT